MSVFLDTGYLVAFHNEDDNQHSKAIELALHMKKGELGTLFTSYYVLDEALTLSLSRFGHNRAVELGEIIIDSEVNILEVSKPEFGNAWKLFRERKNLSFTDCTTAILMKQHSIANLCTFDGGFRQFREINVLG